MQVGSNVSNNMVQKNNSRVPALVGDLLPLVFSHLAFEDLMRTNLVCKEWSNHSGSPIKNAFIIGSDKWTRKWSHLTVSPPSMRPHVEGLNIHELFAKRCPFNPEKLFVVTHLITYIGKEIQLMTETGLKKFPLSINTINDKIKRVFVLFNLNGDSEIRSQTIEKAKWIALYREEIAVFRNNGKNLDLDSDSEATRKMRIAENNEYRFPTVLEYGISFFANQHFGRDRSTWLFRDDSRQTLSNDEFKTNGQEDRFFVSSNKSQVRTQCESYDRITSNDWDTKTFAMMVCKEISPG